MGAEPIHDWQKIAASALDWWCDAGVDTLVDDDVRDWLARPAPRSEPETSALAVAAPIEVPLPGTMAEFIAWRMGKDAPEGGWMTPHFAPTGPEAAEWAVLVDMPESDDSDALLQGAAGRLLDKMLAAIGLARDSVHVMSLAYARPLSGRIPHHDEPRLIELARHQLALVKPKRLLLLGQAASRVLPETNDAGADNHIHHVNHFAAKTAVVASFHPRFLMERPAAKIEAWKHLLLLSRGLAE